MRNNNILETDTEFELYELICSTKIRDYIKPKYEYLLYAILGWWEDCADSEDDLIINLVEINLGMLWIMRKVDLF